MAFATSLRCRECGRLYNLDPIHFCEFCFGPLEVAYDYEAMAKAVSRESIARGPNSLWRYKDFLPVLGDDLVDFNQGFTPLVKAGRLGKVLGLRNLFIKNDCVNPTYSFKDRVVAVAATRARELGFDTLACASTGNLAGATAAAAARAGMQANIFIPADLEQGKVLGAAIYGPRIYAIEGSYDQVNRLCSELADKYHWAFVNVNVRPYYAEGSKTMGYEVVEQLGWRAPDWAVAPLASGSMFTKIYKGYQELVRVGLLDSVHTRMLATQALGCSPIVTAYDEGSFNVRPVRANTIAKSLAIGNPADGYYALKVIEESNGAGVAVTDAEIVEGMKLLAETEGIFAETAGGVTIAGLLRMAQAGAFGADETIVAYITGNGLKTVEAVVEAVAKPTVIQPTLESFEAAYAANAVGAA